MPTTTISSRSTIALFWGAGGAIGKIAGQLLVQITLARILDPESFGQFVVLLSVLSLGSVLADCGFGAALIQKKEIGSNDVSLALGWSLIASIVIALVINSLAPFLAHQFGDESLELMFSISAFLIIPHSVGNLSTNLLQRELQMKIIQIIHLFSYIVCFGGVSTTLALMGWGGWSLIIGYAIQATFKVIATYSVSRHTLIPRLWGDRALIKFGFKSLGNDLANWSMDNLDRFVIGKFWGLYPLGLYSVAFNLSKAPVGMMLYAVQNIAFASSARLQENPLAIKRGFQVVMAATALTTLPLFTIIALESPVILNIIYGEKWIMAAPYMTALAASIPLISLGSVAAAILRGAGAIGTEFRIQLVTAFVFFFGLLFLRNLSLDVAIWNIPLAYLIRLILFLMVAKKLLLLKTLEILLPLRGAVFLATTGVLVTALAHIFHFTSTKFMGVLPLLAGCCALALLFISKFRWCMDSSLLAIIRLKFAQGRLATIIAWLDRSK